MVNAPWSCARTYDVSVRYRQRPHSALSCASTPGGSRDASACCAAVGAAGGPRAHTSRPPAWRSAAAGEGAACRAAAAPAAGCGAGTWRALAGSPRAGRGRCTRACCGRGCCTPALAVNMTSDSAASVHSASSSSSLSTGSCLAARARLAAGTLQAPSAMPSHAWGYASRGSPMAPDQQQPYGMTLSGGLWAPMEPASTARRPLHHANPLCLTAGAGSGTRGEGSARELHIRGFEWNLHSKPVPDGGSGRLSRRKAGGDRRCCSRADAGALQAIQRAAGRCYGTADVL
jgi:hypothetical protein